MAATAFDPWAASPAQASYARRSKLLQALLEGNREAAEDIRSPAELGVRLLAQALTAYGAERNEREAAKARSAYYAREGEGLARALAGLGQGDQAPQAAPPVSAATPQPESYRAPAPPPVQSAPLAPAAPRKPEEIAFRTFIDAGYSAPQAAGIVGNLIAESGLNPNALNRGEGSYGVAQHRLERRDGLHAKYGPAPTYEQQLAYILEELKGPEGAADKALRTAQDPSSAAAAFAGFERPAGWSPGGDPTRISQWARRSGEAQRLFDTYGQPARDVTQLAAGPSPEQVGSQAAQPLPQPPSPVQPFQVAQSGGQLPMPQQQGPQAQGYWFVTPEAKARVLAMAQSGDPQQIMMARQQLLEWQAKAEQPAVPDFQTVGGMPAWVDPRTRSIQVMPLPEQLKAQTQAVGPGSALPQGSVVTTKPDGTTTMLYQPPAGFRPGGQGQQGQQGPEMTAIRGSAPYLENARAMRAEVEKSPTYQAFTRASQIYTSMVKDFATPGRVADINAVYGLATIFDPDSVVREGEQVVIRNSQSLPDWLVGQINRINGGQGLLPEMRAQMLETAQTRLAPMQAQLDQQYSTMGGFAQRMGFDPQDVLPARPSYQPWRRPQGMQGGPAGGQSLPATQGYTPAQLQAWSKVRDLKAPAGSEQRPVPVTSPEQAATFPKGTKIILPDGSIGTVK